MQKMKILLINPPTFNKYYAIREDRMEYLSSTCIAPISLLTCAAILRKNEDHIVDFIDANYEKLSYGKLESILSEKQYDIFIFRAGYLYDDFKLAHISKKANKNCAVITKSIYFDIYYKDILENYPDIDFFIHGELEATLPLLIEEIRVKKEEISIEGVSYIKSGKVNKNSGYLITEDLDTLPLPAYDLLPLTLPHISILTSRGWAQSKNPVIFTFFRHRNQMIW